METSTHQDHVIAHVIGASVLGYFVHDEAAHLVLDIGFVWTVYLDGQMGLLPQGVAISELSADTEFKSRVSRDVDQLQHDLDTMALEQVSPALVACSITEVGLFASTDRYRIVVQGEQAALIIETSISTGAIEISAG